MLPAQFLYKGLDILGTADITYKSSRNQRLHVELTLIKLCNLNRKAESLPDEKVDPSHEQITTEKKTTEQNPVKEPEPKQEKERPAPVNEDSTEGKAERRRKANQYHSQ